jgi:hypothetical protein
LATTNFVISQGYVSSTITNGLVGSSITNGLASLTYVNAATNGLVTAVVTNGLATTNFVASQGYAVSTVTNGFVDASITNGLATTNFVTSKGYVTSAITNGLAGASITNGLATTNYVNSATSVLVTSATLAAAESSAQSYILSVTNGLATTNFVVAQGYTAVKTIWSGTTEGQTVSSGQSVFYPPNNTSPTSNLVDGVGMGTRVPVTETMTLTNLYLIVSAPPGSVCTNTLTIMTNGVASTLTARVIGAAMTATNNITSGVTVLAGTEIGVRLTTSSGATAADWEWSFEGH